MGSDPFSWFSLVFLLLGKITGILKRTQEWGRTAAGTQS